MRDFLYSLIIPHSTNNHRAKILHHKVIALIISFFILSSLFFPSSFNPFSEKLRAIAEISINELLNNTNAKRAENGLPALKNDIQLSNAASKKADDMFAKDYWAHNSPDGITPWFFIKQAGYNYVYAGENLARGFSNASDVINAWMASPSHKANLLSANFKDVGFAVKSGRLNGEETFLVVQEFGNREGVVVAKNSNKKIKSDKVLGINFFSYLSAVTSLNTSTKFVLLTLFILIAVFLIDMIMVERRKIVRFVGHNIDHILFLMALSVVIGGISTGVVI